MTERKGNWMLTASGRQYWPADPRPEEIFIEDVAAHLAKLCRFTGACRDFYSVAEHSVHVARLVQKRFCGKHWIVKCALIHDGTEAYLNDMNRPTKRGPNMGGYRTLEDLNWAAFAKRFDLPLMMPDEVHQADHEMLFHEAAALMPPMPDHIREAWGMGLERPKVLQPEMIQCWSWRQARQEFLNLYEEQTR